MMAKMFYTLDEARAALGRSEEEIMQLSREGRLRMFRDGSHPMFKSDQVEQLKAELGGGSDMVDLGPSDSGSPIGLVDSKGASGTAISMSDLGGSGTGMAMKEDTALAADLGLSGSSAGDSASGLMSPGASRGGSASGLNIFADEGDKADPSAQTAISAGSLQDQVNLEGVGSGSGLLDLTRENDDTSLGAELKDEINLGRIAGDASGSSAGSSIETMTSSAPLVTPSRAPMAATGPVFVEAPDALAPAFGGAALGAAVVLLAASTALVGGITGAFPAFVKPLAEYGLWVLAGIGLGVVAIFFVIGLVLGKMSTR